MGIPKDIKEVLKGLRRAGKKKSRELDRKNFEEAAKKAAAIQSAMLYNLTQRKVPAESPHVKLLQRLKSPQGLDLISKRVEEIFIILDRVEIAIAAYHGYAEIKFMESLFLPEMLAKETGRHRISDLVYPSDIDKIREIISHWLIDAEKQLSDFERLVKEHGEKAVNLVVALLRVEDGYRKVFNDKETLELLQGALDAYHKQSD